MGAIVNLLKKKAMYENTLLIYSSDNGAGGGPPHLTPGTGTGLNWPFRGEKHTNWDGGLKAAAFISGGLVPAQLRGTSSDVNCHIVDWCECHMSIFARQPDTAPILRQTRPSLISLA